MQLAYVCTALILAGGPCRADDGAGTPSPKFQSVTDILQRIRQDIGYYEVQAARWRKDIPPDLSDPAMIIPAHDDPPDATHTGPQHWPERMIKPACPVDGYDFDVTKVEVTLQAVSGKTGSADGGLNIPYIGTKLGADISLTLGLTQAKTIVLDRLVPYDVPRLRDYSQSEDYGNLVQGQQTGTTPVRLPDGSKVPLSVLPFSDALFALRQNLVQASETLPCFEVDNSPNAANSIKIDFQLQKSTEDKIGFTFMVIDAKAATKTDNSSDNSITISFAPHVRADIVTAKQ